MLRLDVNTAGAWKTVVPEFQQDDIDAVREAALTLARMALGSAAFRIVDRCVKPMGQVLWRTNGKTRADIHWEAA
jgi:hypothetical protein